MGAMVGRWDRMLRSAERRQRQRTAATGLLGPCLLGTVRSFALEIAFKKSAGDLGADS